MTPSAREGLGRAALAERRPGVRVGLFGCAPDTGNLGVSALAASAVRGLASAGGVASLVLFDYGRTSESDARALADPRLELRLVSCFHSRRIYRSHSLVQAELAARLGLRRLHPMLRLLGTLDAVLDVTGGDSFADLYGPARFRATTLPKRVALLLGRPLLLLPQTYGPYRSERARREAQQLVRAARAAWSRDADGLEVLRELLGDDFDPARHRGGVDLAFGLEPRRPGDAALEERLAEFAAGADLLVGVNASGLLWDAAAAQRFGLKGSYRTLMHELLARLLALDGVRVLLVPHVVSSVESDLVAGDALVAGVAADDRERVLRVPAGLTVAETKWVIGQCDWFVGARMHACIGAISQAVPTVAIAYSEKTRGVLETAGVGAETVDPRHVAEPELVEAILQRFEERQQVAARLREALPALRVALDAQFQAIVAAIP